MTAPKRQPTGADEPVAGLVVDPAATVRSGEDTRQRGWFWHWNSLVTQYAPLLGLKGVGLLNSYTVWTDRREESPHRGYAFPSQQREADFYGEDRAELITINKILVALDLIEIRKEMVLRTDPQGRRWRVPHNLYRVKDPGDDFTLSSREVLAVVALADGDKAVYRYVRRIFSPKFAPIDGDNVWHAILAEVRPTPLWRRLAERAEQEDLRASARTRAGHAARRGAAPTPKIFVPEAGDATTMPPTGDDTAAVVSDQAWETNVASTNRGSTADVAPVNNGWAETGATSVGPSTAESGTSVDESNTTYHQSLTTTKNDGMLEHLIPSPVASGNASAGTAISVSGGPGVAPVDAPAAAAALRAFAEANNRPATPAERKLLRDLAHRFSATPDGDDAHGGIGWNRLGAAIYEAVEAGSAFVAPRRLREILTRWERAGYPQETPPAGADSLGAERDTMDPAPSSGAGQRAEAATAPDAALDFALDPALTIGLIRAGLGVSPPLRLPHGQLAGRTWDYVVTSLAGSLTLPALRVLVAGTAITGYDAGVVRVAAPSAAQAEALASTHRALIERKLTEALRRPVRLAVGSPSGAAAPAGDAAPAPARRRPLAAEAEPPVAPPASFELVECGLASGQVWAAVLGEVARDPGVGRADFEAWLRATQLLGRAAAGAAGSALIVGVPHSLAQRRVSSRFADVLAAAVTRVVGTPLTVEIVVSADWQSAANPAATDEAVGA